MRLRKSLIHGVGKNDADYSISSFKTGVRVLCPFYLKWTDMLKRCYCVKYQLKRNTYIGCTVCDEWLTFSNFKAWMVMHDWHGKHLDKDIIIKGNKVYSPDACSFVDQATNKFIMDGASIRGNQPIGVSCCPKTGRFKAYCKNPFSLTQDYLGMYDCPNQANAAWRNKKHELACRLADIQSDERVSKALRMWYL